MKKVQRQPIVCLGILVYPPTLCILSQVVMILLAVYDVTIIKAYQIRVRCASLRGCDIRFETVGARMTQTPTPLVTISIQPCHK